MQRYSQKRLVRNFVVLISIYLACFWIGIMSDIHGIHFLPKYNVENEHKMMSSYIEEKDDVSEIGATAKIIDSQQQQQQHNNRTKRKVLHVLNGIYVNNNKRAFSVEEWEVNFKSVLSNAPIDNDIHIHVITNEKATEVINELIEKTHLIKESRWRNKVSLTLYNVESKLDEWEEFLNKKTRGVTLDSRVSIGGYFRLMAHNVLKLNKQHDIDEVVYMDTDVVILSNLNDLMRHMNTTHVENESMIWQYAASNANSGFMVLNVKKFDRFWELIDKLPEIKHGGDQNLLSMIVEEWPNANYRGIIPSEWNIHLGHGWRRAPHKLYSSGQKIGMVHFTGSYGKTYFHEPGVGLDKNCDYHGRGGDCKGHLDEYHSSWGLADYYVRLPWHSLIYFGSSRINNDELGHPFHFEILNC